MARLFSSGFELNTDSGNFEWTARSGVQTFTTTNQRSGTYALQLSSLGSAVAKGLRYDFQTAANNGPFYTRVYVKFVTLPGAESRIILLNDTSAITTPIVYLTVDSGGVLKLYDEDGQITGTSTLSTATWYRIEFEIDVTAAAGSHVVKARVDGTEFAAATNRSLSAGVMTLAVGANLGLEANGSGEWYIDDVAVNNSAGSFQNSYPGEGEIIHLRPSAAGDNNAWTRGGTDSGANWSQVDEVTPNDATDYVESNTANQIDDYNLEATPAAMDSSDVINVIHVMARMTLSSSAGSDPNAALRIKSDTGATVEESANVGINSVTWFTNGQSSMNPILTLYDLPGASTTAWTKATLDTAQIGIRQTVTDTDSFRLSTIWLLVDHKPGAGGTSYNFAATISMATATPDATLNIARPMAAVSAWQTATPDAALTVARSLSAASDWQTVTPDAALTVARTLASVMTWQTATPDAALVIARALVSIMDWQTATPAAALTVARSLSAVSDWQTVTPDATLVVAHALAAVSGWQTVTPDASVVVLRALVAASDWQTVTPDAALTVARLMSALSTWQTLTPDAGLTTGGVLLAASIGWQTVTPDATLNTLRALVASIDGQVVTPAAALVIARVLTSVSAWQTVTPDAALAVARPLAAVSTWQTATPDASLVNLVSLASAISWQTSTPDAALTVTRAFQATSAWQTATGQAMMTLIIRFSAVSTWQTVTPAATLDTGVLAVGVVRVAFSAKVPGVSFTSKQPKVTFTEE